MIFTVTNHSPCYGLGFEIGRSRIWHTWWLGIVIGPIHMRIDFQEDKDVRPHDASE